MKQIKSLALSLIVANLLPISILGQDVFLNLPKEANPVVVGNLIISRFLEQGHSQYGSPLRVNEPRTQITYPDVCTWLGGLWFTQEIGDKTLAKRLEQRFTPLFSTEKHLQPVPNHVDNNVFGALALELYLQTNNPKYKKLGLMYADTQWQLPVTATESEKAWASKGYSWQTRVWLDDMFMITAVQGQAYRVTKNIDYLNRTAREMVMYIDSIQQGNGLFYHSPEAHFCWGRGNGWLAVGMAEVLRVIPEDNPDRPAIMAGYLKMMNKLKELQCQDGMWRQVVDDNTMWKETSGSAMFAYAMIVGTKKGWLPKEIYGELARKAWVSLCTYITPNGDIKDVCEGTNIGNTTEYYRGRLPLTGDLHGQAPLLWCAYALLSKNL